MNVTIEQRQSGKIPLGAFAMLPLFALPLGVWMVQQEWANLGTCALKMVMGIPCLTCGATRATVRLFSGDLMGALSFQPMIVVVYFLLAIWGLVSFGLFVRDKRARIKLGKVGDRVFKGSLIVLPILNWVYLIVVGI
jgi:uncharacterized membrane protein